MTAELPVFYFISKINFQKISLWKIEYWEGKKGLSPIVQRGIVFIFYQDNGGNDFMYYRRFCVYTDKYQENRK